MKTANAAKQWDTFEALAPTTARSCKLPSMNSRVLIKPLALMSCSRHNPASSLQFPCTTLPQLALSRRGQIRATSLQKIEDVSGRPHPVLPSCDSDSKIKSIAPQASHPTTDSGRLRLLARKRNLDFVTCRLTCSYLLLKPCSFRRSTPSSSR